MEKLKTLNFNGKWITSGVKNENYALPPEIFRKNFTLEKMPEKAEMKITSLGIYEAYVNGEKVCDDLFLPGYTNYKSHIQAQSFDISKMLKKGENSIEVTVANGWYLGKVGYKGGGNTYGDTRALIADITVDGKVIPTDTSWQVSHGGKNIFADFYDGQIINNTVGDPVFEPVKIFDGKTPQIIGHIGTTVKICGTFEPKRYYKAKSGIVYDFGQNFAGVVRMKVRAKKGTVITVKHAEIMMDGDIFTENYRSAKAELKLICEEGINEFFPTLTFMGFRYASVSVSDPDGFDLIRIEGVAFSSYMKNIGSFECSDEMINKLQNCVVWGTRSNFLEIPTDCPQRDERLGWTGDACVFCNTASYNFDTSLFFKKWLLDLRSEQSEDGGIPVTIPVFEGAEPAQKRPPVCVWGDVATVLPWTVYRNYGSKTELSLCYESMKKYVLHEKAYAEKAHRCDRKYLWDKNVFQYGDWCAYGEPFEVWSKRGNYLSTAWYFNSVRIVAEAAEVLGKKEDHEFFADLSEKIRAAFVKYYLKKDGSLKPCDFMSMYVCSLYFGLVPEDFREKTAKKLADMVIKNDYKVMTGFPGTPYLLFALCDNGYEDLAYKVLSNGDCPGWMHMVKNGATTTWERWDAIEQDGSFFHEGAGMVSFNHYAYGSLGDFFYRRILGLESTSPGYKTFTVRPFTGDLTYARGFHETPYGTIEIAWKKSDGIFTLDLTVPEGSSATVILPNVTDRKVTSGKHMYTVKM